MDKTKILETLTEWNYWKRELPDTIVRERYESEVLQKSTTGEIVILKGVRRSGKSTILINTIKQLFEKGVDRNLDFLSFHPDSLLNQLFLTSLPRRVNDSWQAGRCHLARVRHPIPESARNSPTSPGPDVVLPALH